MILAIKARVVGNATCVQVLRYASCISKWRLEDFENHALISWQSGRSVRSSLGKEEVSQ